MAVIDLGAEESRRLGHDWLGTEHLLLAFGQRRQLLPAAAAGLLPDAGRLAPGALRTTAQQRPELLRTVRSRLDQVRAAVRQTSATRRPTGSPNAESIGLAAWRRPSRRCDSLLTGSKSMAPGLKQAFERAATKPTGAGGPRSTPPPS
jgi:hypothetical protein